MTSTTAFSVAVLNSYQMEFCLPSNSTTLGLNSKKPFPIGLLIDKLILELTFEDPSACLFCPIYSVNATTALLSTVNPNFALPTTGLTAIGTTTPLKITALTYNISNVFFHYDVLKLSDAAMNLVVSKAVNDGGIIIPGLRFYTNPENNITQTSKAYQKLVDAYYSSVKSIWCNFKPVSNKTSFTSLYQSNYVEPYLNYYQFKIGNRFLTSYQINSEYYTLGNAPAQTTRSWIYHELLKSFHKSHNPNGNDQLYNSAQFCNTTTGVFSAFLIGGECEIYCSPGSDVLADGIDSRGKPITTYLNFYGSGGNITTDASGLYMNLYISYDVYYYLPLTNSSFLGSIEVLE